MNNNDIFRMLMGRLHESGHIDHAHTIYFNHLHKVFKSKRLRKRNDRFELDCHGMNMAIAKRFVISQLKYFEETYLNINFIPINELSKF